MPARRRINLVRAASVSSLRTLSEIAAHTATLTVACSRWCERRGRYRLRPENRWKAGNHYPSAYELYQ